MPDVRNPKCDEVSGNQGILSGARSRETRETQFKAERAHSDANEAPNTHQKGATKRTTKTQHKEATESEGSYSIMC